MVRRFFLWTIASGIVAALPAMTWAKPRKDIPLPITRRGTVTGTTWEDCGRRVALEMGKPAPGWVRVSTTIVIVYVAPNLYRGTWDLTDLQQTK